MDNGTILILTFTFPVFITIAFYFLMKRRKKNHSEVLNSDFKDFNKAISNKHIKGIAEFGKKLIWNESLTMDLLNKMFKSLKTIENKYSELKELENLIYNKYLDWNKEYPKF